MASDPSAARLARQQQRVEEQRRDDEDGRRAPEKGRDESHVSVEAFGRGDPYKVAVSLPLHLSLLRPVRCATIGELGAAASRNTHKRPSRAVQPG